jgi:hypothetical protein
MNGHDVTADALRMGANAARDLVAALRGEGHDDDTIHDTAEGELSLHDAISRALAEIDECEVMGLGLSAKIGEFSARKERCEFRADRLRGLIEQAMVVADLSAIKLPTATLTVKAIPPKAIVTDEAQLPARFWRSPPPVLDKTAINDAVKAGEAIPGVSMTNGTTSLQIRRA